MKKVPLSYYQKPFWLDWKLTPKSSKYNTPLVYRLEGYLEVDALIKSLHCIINEYYDVAKHYFKEYSNGEVEQIVLDSVEVKLEIKEFLEKTAGGQQEHEEYQELGLIKTFVDKICDYSFNLTQFPLFKFTLLKINEYDHILILNYSHIITDAYTAQFWIKTHSRLYNHFAYQDSKPDRSFFSYMDYVKHEQSRYSQEKKLIDLEYWEKKLENKTIKIHLPTMHTHSTTNGSYYFSLDSTRLKAIKQLAKLESSTIFIVLSAMYAVLLNRYTRETELCFSYALDARPLGYKNIPGCFVNNLPWVVTLDKEQTFSGLIKQLTQTRKEARAHQRCSLTDIIQSLKEKGKLNSEDNMNVGIGETFLCLESLTFKNLKVTALNVCKQESYIDMFLAYQINHMDNTLDFRLDYNSALFTADFIKQMVQHFEVILNQALMAPKNNIMMFSLLTTQEKQKIVFDWNYTYKNYTHDKAIHQLFEAQVKKTPNSNAVVFETGSPLNTTITFDELNRRANKIANLIKKQLGFPKKPIIAICLERQLELVIGILAILKVGGCYMPFDSEETDSRMHLLLKNTKVDAVLTTSGYLKKIRALRVVQLIIRIDVECTEPFIRENLEDKIYEPGDLAYIIHTSGTSGIPKGVMIEHHSLVNIISDLKNKFKTSEKDKILNLTSVAFDVFTSDLFHCLTSGACLVLCSNEVLRDPKKAADLIALHRINNKSFIDSLDSEDSADSGRLIVHATPTTWSMVLNFLEQSSSAQSTNIEKKPMVAISGGESLKLQVVKRMFDVTKHVWNFYGPTETTICSTFEKVEEVNKSPSIGKGFANVELYVLDEYLQPIPVGVCGELYIGGAGLARGYLDDEKLTSDKFIQKPVFLEANKNNLPIITNHHKTNKLYKTGDLVMWNNQGKLEYLGRKDNQIKIRGNRVELGEIESILSSHPLVEACVVSAISTELVAYYVPKHQTWLQKLLNRNGTTDMTPNQLSAYLKKYLPSFMQPIAFVKLNKIPLSITGKLNKSQLPEPTPIDFISGSESVRPYNTIELKLKEIWSKVLSGVVQPTFGVLDDFFELGGHSLSAVLLVTRINEAFNTQYPVVWGYEHKSIRSQAKHILKYSKQQITYNPMIAYNASLHLTPLFFIHPAMAGAEAYDSLAHLLGNDIPFYSIDSYNLNSGKPWLNTIEALAEQYILYMKTIKPCGPYLLGGWSYGGVVAFEMARQLVKMGEKVDKIYLLDACLFKNGVIKDYLERITLEQLADMLPKIWSDYLSELPKYYRERIYECYRNDATMLSQYVLKPYEGQGLLLKSTTSSIKFNKLFLNHMHNGWKPWIKNLEIKTIQADHFNLLEGEHLKEVARLIKEDVLSL